MGGPGTSRGRRTLAWFATPGPVQVALLVVGMGWVLDQATKTLAVRGLGGGRAVDVPGPLFLSLTFNEGAAFGIPAPWWLFIVVTVIVVVLAARNLPRATNLAEPVAYGLLVAGALGNVTDRLIRHGARGVGRGQVVDFIASSFWPTFNVADILITVGFVVLVVAAWRQERGASEPARLPPRERPVEQR